MLIANTGQSLVIMNLRTGEQVQLPPGQRTSLADSKIQYIDDSAVLIALFNAGVLVAYTDAGAAYPGFPTSANPEDSRFPPRAVDLFARRPSADSVPNGFVFLATDLGRMRWVSDGSQWILLSPCTVVGAADPQSIVDTASPQGTQESTLYSLSLPANALAGNDGLQLDLLWSCTNSAAAKRIRARFGGTVLFNVDLTTHLVFRQSVKLRNRNSRAAQVSQGNSTTNFGPIGSVGVQTFTVDFAAAQALTITGQFPVAGTGTNTLSLEEVTIQAI